MPGDKAEKQGFHGSARTLLVLSMLAKVLGKTVKFVATTKLYSVGF